MLNLFNCNSVFRNCVLVKFIKTLIIPSDTCRIVNGLLKTALGPPSGSTTTLSPAQDITYHKDSGDYELRNGGYITIPYSYTVSSDGSVLFNAVSNQLYIEPVEGDNEIYHLDYSFYKAKSIYVGGGEIKAVVDCGIYDFISGMMIKGTVTLSYERFTFAL